MTGATTGVAIVGAGGVARRHAEMLSRVGGVRVVTVTDLDEAAAERLARDCGARAVADLDAALDASGVDAAYVCVPPFAHGAPERAVLDRGLPLFVEKPVAADAATAVELAGRVERAGVVTGTGYHWRCLDVLDVARPLLAERPPLLAHGSWLDKRPPVGWWPHTALSGGQVVEQVTHVLDLARLLLGEAEEVYAAGARRTPAADGAGRDAESDTGTGSDTEGDIDDATAATVRFTSGAVATVAATSLLGRRHHAGLRLLGPGLVVDLSDEGMTVDRGDGAVFTPPGIDPRLVVDQEFIAAVRGEREDTRAPYREAVRSHLLACAIAESARRRQAVRVSDVTVEAAAP